MRRKYPVPKIHYTPRHPPSPAVAWEDRPPFVVPILPPPTGHPSERANFPAPIPIARDEQPEDDWSDPWDDWFK
jgi:hypothetical protein